MVDPKLGTKRVCEACEAKFYDLNKSPIVCPKCGHVHDPMAAAMPEKPVAEIEPTVEAQEDDEDTLEEDDDALSLDDIVEDQDDDDGEDGIGEFSDDKNLLDNDEDDLLDDAEDDDDAFGDEDDDA